MEEQHAGAIEEQPTSHIYTVSGSKFYDNAVYTGSDTALASRNRRNYRFHGADDVTTRSEVGLRCGCTRRKSVVVICVIGFLVIAVLGLIAAVVVTRLEMNKDSVTPTSAHVVQTSVPASTTSRQTTYSTVLPSALTTTSSSIATTDCTPAQFRCISDGRCIPALWRCDNSHDCVDRSDELGCGCPAGEVKCASVRPSVCISMTQVCDGVAHCDDYSDEDNCGTRRVDCSASEFECIQSAECVGTSRVCDGVPDCRDQSDEWYNCSVTSQAPPTSRIMEVRLMQDDVDTTSQLAGRVEIRRHGTNDTFGTICDDKWTKENAEVVCRMILNTQFDGSAYAYTDALFGEGSGPVVMTNVRCYGNESNIGNCESSGFGQEMIFCSRRQDVGVSCVSN